MANIKYRCDRARELRRVLPKPKRQYGPKGYQQKYLLSRKIYRYSRLKLIKSPFLLTIYVKPRRASYIVNRTYNQFHLRNTNRDMEEYTSSIVFY